MIIIEQWIEFIEEAEVPEVIELTELTESTGVEFWAENDLALIEVNWYSLFDWADWVHGW